MSRLIPGQRFATFSEEFPTDDGGYLEISFEADWHQGVPVVRSDLRGPVPEGQQHHPYISDHKWSRINGVQFFLWEVFNEAEISLDDAVIDRYSALVADFQEYVDGGMSFEVDVIRTTFSHAEDASDDYDDYNDPFEEDEDYDPNYCEQCGDYSDSVMSGALYAKTGKFDAHVWFQGIESCTSGREVFSGHPSTIPDDIIQYLEFQKGNWDELDAFLAAVKTHAVA